MPYKDPEKQNDYQRERYWKTLKVSRARGRKNKASWRAKNPEESKRRDEEYARNNPEKRKKTLSKHHATHKTKRNSYSRKYKREHPEVIKALIHKRRTQKTKAGGSFTSAEWFALCKLYGNRCLCCGKRKKLTADHVIPVAKGGTSNIDNIQPLCGPCNAHKHTGTTDFRLNKTQGE